MSRLDGLPVAIREYVQRRLREGASQSQIVQETTPMLAEIGEAPLSPAGLNRYSSRVEAAGRRIREAREAAAAWASTAAEGSGDVGRHTLEVLRTLAMELLLRGHESADAEEAPFSPAEMKDLALTLHRVEQAGEHAARREAAMRREMAEEASKQARKLGIGADLVDALRAALDTPA